MVHDPDALDAVCLLTASGREFSAGGVVVRGDEVAVIVPVKRAADGTRVLGLPKGHPDGDETARAGGDPRGRARRAGVERRS